LFSSGLFAAISKRLKICDKGDDIKDFVIQAFANIVDVFLNIC